MQAPSLSNSTGTLLGTLAGSLVVSATPTIPFIIAAAAALGMTPLAFSGVLGVAATALVNYGVTHFAEVKNWNELAQEYWPQIEATYPAPKDGAFTSPPVASGQSNSNINHGS